MSPLLASKRLASAFLANLRRLEGTNFGILLRPTPAWRAGLCKTEPAEWRSRINQVVQCPSSNTAICVYVSKASLVNSI